LPGIRALIQIKASLGFFWTDSASDFNCNMGKILRGGIPLTLCVMVALSGCNRALAAVDATARHYEARGIIRGFAPDRSTVDIEHEDIRGFMPSMTMPLSVHNPKEIVDLKTGDPISFRLNVMDQDVWIDNVKKIAPNEVHLPTLAPTPAISPKVSERLKEDFEANPSCSPSFSHVARCQTSVPACRTILPTSRAPSKPVAARSQRRVCSVSRSIPHSIRRKC
jgi:Cu/Ag efflux protein CusF